MPLFTTKHYYEGLAVVALCNGYGKIVMLAIVSARFLWWVVVNLEVVSDHRRTRAFRVALHVFGLNTQLMLIRPMTKGPGEARRIPGTPRADTKGPRESTEEAQQKPRETQAGTVIPRAEGRRERPG